MYDLISLSRGLSSLSEAFRNLPKMFGEDFPMMLSDFDDDTTESDTNFSVRIPFLGEGCEVKAKVEDSTLKVKQVLKGTKSYFSRSIPERFNVPDGVAVLEKRGNYLVFERSIDEPKEECEETCNPVKDLTGIRLGYYKKMMEKALAELDVEDMCEYMRKYKDLLERTKNSSCPKGENEVNCCSGDEKEGCHMEGNTFSGRIRSKRWRTDKDGRLFRK